MMKVFKVEFDTWNVGESPDTADGGYDFNVVADDAEHAIARVRKLEVGSKSSYEDVELDKTVEEEVAGIVILSVEFVTSLLLV